MGYLQDPLPKIIDDKIGKSTDYWNSDKSVFGYANIAYQHIHQNALCYPTLANGVSITTGVSEWALGDFVEIIPENTITNAFDIHFINFESASSDGTYELHLFTGLAGEEVLIAKIRTTKEANPSVITSNVPVQTPVQAPNSRISARVASNNSGQNVSVSLFYHVYV